MQFSDVEQSGEILNPQVNVSEKFHLLVLLICVDLIKSMKSIEIIYSDYLKPQRWWCLLIVDVLIDDTTHSKDDT